MPRNEKEMLETPPETWQQGKFSWKSQFLNTNSRRMPYFDQSSSFNEIDTIFVVLFHACSNRQNVWVKNDVDGIESNFFSQNSKIS